MATESFLSEFPPVSTEQWEHIIREKITGAEYASKLIWHPEEGLAVKPYYRAEDLAGLQFLDAPAGKFPFVRGGRSSGDWRIREEVNLVDAEDANQSAREVLAAGAEEIAFRHTKLENPGDLAILLADLHEIPVAFVGSEPRLVRLLVERLSNRPHSTIISADLDPLADLELSAELISNAPPGFRPFVIHADQFQERAAGSLEEVGFALSAAVDFIAEMRERGLSIDRITGSMSFAFAIGPEFFIQIAKLRAFRLVWAKVVECFEGAIVAARPLIHTRTAYWNATVYDPQTNILRSTTEAISAALGGVDSISISPFDECFRHPDDSSRRLARNTQVILKQEAFLSRVVDPVGGSYMIEALTNSIASKAWKLFQELETAGGFRRALASGVIASVLDRRMTSREEAVANRRRTFTGTNRFADASEQALARVDASHSGSVARAAQSFETLRLRTEQFINQTGEQPHILLAEIGDTKMRSARSQFAADFLACAGLVTNKAVFQSAECVADSDARLVVLCSSDVEYPPIAAELVQRLRKHNRPARVIIAGNPDTAEELRNIGIVDFIHLRSNAVEVLAKIQQMIGIKD
ncbi:methylmalonyl-CoA mutase family protein [Telmatobacter sp. DSM 110680]|uniref:Methylmalonyl-CoA mutase family protein n=1 Tax=Telmatobacter sp. DSM 110680 TaxID=3036704 RepID=A0AAU7DMX0_9BACT